MALTKAEKTLFAGLSVNFVAFGASMFLFAAAGPRVIEEYGWSITEAGVVFAAAAIGYFLSTFASGLLLHRLGPKGVLAATLLLQSASFFFFARSPSIVLNTALNLAIGLGQGGTEVVSNYSVIRLERDGRSRLMNLMHAFFCVGGIIGPLGVAGLLQSRVGWRVVFVAMGVLLALLAVAFALMRFDSVRPEASSARGERRERAAAGRPGLLFLYASAILVYVGIELSVSNWSPLLFVRTLGASAEQGASVLAVLWTGLLAGRLGVSFLYRGSRQQRPLLLLAAATVVFLAALLAAPSVPTALAAVLLLGLGLSGIYPLVMTMVGKMFASPAAVGIVTTAGGIGSFSFPFALAWIGDRWGLRNGFFFVLAVSGVLLLNAAAIAASARKLAASAQG